MRIKRKKPLKEKYKTDPSVSIAYQSSVAFTMGSFSILKWAIVLYFHI